MHKLCLLFLEEGNNWQKDELTGKIILSYPFGTQWTDEGVEMEREARIVYGEESGIDRFKLVNEYIKRYYPEHTKPSDVFGALVNLDRSKPESKNLKAEITTVIDNCLSEKYGYLKRDPQNDQMVYLTTEGRNFANPPYFPWSRVNIGLINGYIKAMGPARTVLFGVAAFIFAEIIIRNWDAIVRITGYISPWW